MNTEQFQDLLDRHGADLARWPREARVSAERLVAESAAAGAALKRAQGLDAALGRLINRQQADDDAVMRVVARLNARPLPRQKLPLWRLPATLFDVQFSLAWPRVAALGACAVIGFFVGISGIDRKIGTGGPADPIDAPFISAGSSDLGAVFEPETPGGDLP